MMKIGIKLNIMNETENKRGGARKNAGLAPDADGEKLKAYRLTLDHDTSCLFREVGMGNMSRGARVVARVFAATNTTKDKNVV
jgi:hypothetical protein